MEEDEGGSDPSHSILQGERKTPKMMERCRARKKSNLIIQ